MPRSPARLLIPAFVVLSLAAPALAQPFPGGWGGARHGAWPDDGGRVATQGNAEPSRRIDVETFRAADAGDLLGKGRIVVTDAPPPAPIPHDADHDGPAIADGGADEKLPVYEAAVIDRLAGKGYDVAHAADPGQLVEVTISKDVVVPEEAPHKPVSGEMSVGVSNRGSGYGLALAVDLSKPRKAIVATRLDVRIRDKATHRVLWEGYAQGQARETGGGDDDTQMAGRLAGALFARFPQGKVVQPMEGASPLSPPNGAGE